jgi:hypothetical protein
VQKVHFLHSLKSKPIGPILINKQGELVNWTLPYTRLDDGINNPFYESSVSQVSAMFLNFRQRPPVF